MKKIAIVSGKGGVGKSMISSSLSILFSEKVVAVDCDVDAPNLAVWLGEPEDWDETFPVSTSQKAQIDPEKCTGCGVCEKTCRFSAIKMVNGKPEVNPFLCEGCGACSVACPSGAITLKKIQNGEIRKKQTKYGFPLYSGQLLPGETGSGKVVSEIKEKVPEKEIMIIDSPPGTGCPVIAALRDIDLAVLVTEPTPSAFSDLKRVLEVVEYFNIPWKLVVNKWDINEDLSNEIIKWAGNNFFGKLSYDKEVFRAVSKLVPILETDLNIKEEIKEIYNNIEKWLGQQS